MRDCIYVMVALITGCGSYVPPDSLFGPRWDLRRPVYVSISDTMPKHDQVLQAVRAAVVLSGGTLTPNPETLQFWHVGDTDGGNCQADNGVSAFTDLPANGTSFFCHSTTVLASYSQQQIDAIAAHEWGHELANRRDHIGGEPVTPPAANCTSHAVMSNNIVCHPNEPVYGPADRSYICDWHNVIGGLC